MVSNNYRLNYLPGHDNKHSQTPRMISSSASFIGRVKTKKRASLGGGCVEICGNEQVSHTVYGRKISSRLAQLNLASLGTKGNYKEGQELFLAIVLACKLSCS